MYLSLIPSFHYDYSVRFTSASVLFFDEKDSYSEVVGVKFNCIVGGSDLILLNLFEVLPD